MQRDKKPLCVKFRQRLSPIAPDLQCLWPDVSNQRRQIRLKVIAASLHELVKKIRRPVLVINLQTVAEHSVRPVRRKSLHQPIANVLQVVFVSCRIEVIEHVTLAANCGTFYLHAGTTADEENNFLGLIYALR